MTGPLAFNSFHDDSKSKVDGTNAGNGSSDPTELFGEATSKVTAESQEILTTVVDTGGTFWKNVDLCVASLDFVHATTGLPWWAAIAGTTVVVRSALLPVAIKVRFSSHCFVYSI